jgi:hypothetical protein
MPGTDTFLADPMIGIPTIWPYSGTGVHTHHNSADRPETVDLRSLRDLAVVNATWLYFLANADDTEKKWMADLYARYVEQHPPASVKPRAAAKTPGRGIVVKRKRFGTIPLDDLHEDKREGYPSSAWATVPTIALFWCDGKRDLAEVIRLTELELGPQKFDFVGYFRFLAKHGYVDIVETGVSK